LNLADKIRKEMVSAISDYQMLEDGDRVMVAVSGGKDSTALLILLEEIRRRAKIKFTVHGVMLDQKQPGFDADRYKAWITEKGLELTILEKDTYSIVLDKTAEGKAFCSMCSRLRRGILYNYAHQNNYTKIALGHHQNDLNESILMSMFFNGVISSMPPKLLSDDKRNTVIRPLCYVAEQTIIDYSKEEEFPVIPCNLCGSQDTLRRQEIKQVLAQLQKNNPSLAGNLLASQKNIKISQLMDRNLWDFQEFSPK
jgi:tRNA 2-thiocytidine biosynthesis protein TtcA